MDGSMTEQDILRLARERYQAGVDGDYYNRQRQQEDTRFYKGGREQWDEAAITQRGNRPAVTINRLPQFVKQVTGEMRQNKPAIRVLPVDEKTDPELAKVYTAIIRHIESLSDAHRVYNKAGEQAVIGGCGWFRIVTDYLSDTSFEQEIKIKSVKNPLSVVFDNGAVELTRHDMNWCFVSEEIPVAAFQAQYPKASLNGFTTDRQYQEWRRGEFIRVAEYWVREPHNRELLLLSDGSTRYGDEVTPDVAAMMDQAGIQIMDRRKVKAFKVKWYKMTGVEILSRGEWAGKYIPIIPVVGEEIEVGDEVFRHGLIHHSKDSQRGYNFARSAMIEHIATQPKAPYLATADMVKNHKSMWESLNTSNPPVLLYDADQKVPGARPVREQPPTFAAAWYQEAQIADNDMKATTGIYDASLGKSGNETSGRAIMARDQQGETATYVYVDNLSASIRQAGLILLDLIPHIYSDERVIRIMGEDGAIEGYARINTRLPGGLVFNDISTGQFDLEVTTGPAFATKRMESADKMMQLVQSVPQIGQVGADMIVKALDMPNGDKLADRLAMVMLPPGIDEEVDQKRMEMQAKAAQMAGPQQPDPMQQLALADAQSTIAERESKTLLNQAKAASEQSAIQAMVSQMVMQTLGEIGIQAGFNQPGIGDGL
jgi:hypothetical protein